MSEIYDNRSSAGREKKKKRPAHVWEIRQALPGRGVCGLTSYARDAQRGGKKYLVVAKNGTSAIRYVIEGKIASVGPRQIHAGVVEVWWRAEALNPLCGCITDHTYIKVGDAMEAHDDLQAHLAVCPAQQKGEDHDAAA